MCGDAIMNRSIIFRWAAKFKEGQTSTEDNPRSGRLRTSTDAINASIVATIIEEGWRLTLEEIAREANLCTIYTVYYERLVTPMCTACCNIKTATWLLWRGKGSVCKTYLDYKRSIDSRLLSRIKVTVDRMKREMFAANWFCHQETKVK